jgi:NAD/NADP transhydrogenase alpha subunit
VYARPFKGALACHSLSDQTLTILRVPVAAAYEERVTITPETAKQLMDKFDVHVERSPTRIIKDGDYEKVKT